jgi:hypothetical protein
MCKRPQATNDLFAHNLFPTAFSKASAVRRPKLLYVQFEKYVLLGVRETGNRFTFVPSFHALRRVATQISNSKSSVYQLLKTIYIKNEHEGGYMTQVMVYCYLF